MTDAKMIALQYREAERLWVDEELVKDDDVTAFGQMLSRPSASVGVWGESDDGDSHGSRKNSSFHICILIYVSIHPSIHLSIYLSLSIYLPIKPSLSVFDRTRVFGPSIEIIH